MARIYDKRCPIVGGLYCMEVPAMAQADMVVFVVPNRTQAKEQYFWFYESASPASTNRDVTKVCWVNKEKDADLLVFFTKNKANAGWRKLHDRRERL